MTLREIGTFLLELSEEFVAAFLWKTNWLDTNLLVIVSVCLSYLAISVIGGAIVHLSLNAMRSQFRKSGGFKGLLGLLIEQFFSFWLGWVLIILLGWLWSSFAAKWGGLIFGPSLLFIFWAFILRDWGVKALAHLQKNSKFNDKL